MVPKILMICVNSNISGKRREKRGERTFDFQKRIDMTKTDDIMSVNGKK